MHSYVKDIHCIDNLLDYAFSRNAKKEVSLKTGLPSKTKEPSLVDALKLT